MMKPQTSATKLYVVPAMENTSTDFKMDNLLVMGEYKEYNQDGELVITSGDYDVEVSSRMISKWTHNSIPLQYFIALEP